MYPSDVDSIRYATLHYLPDLHHYLLCLAFLYLLIVGFLFNKKCYYAYFVSLPIVISGLVTSVEVRASLSSQSNSPHRFNFFLGEDYYTHTASESTCSGVKGEIKDFWCACISCYMVRKGALSDSVLMQVRTSSSTHWPPCWTERPLFQWPVLY